MPTETDLETAATELGLLVAPKTHTHRETLDEKLRRRPPVAPPVYSKVRRWPDDFSPKEREDFHNRYDKPGKPK